LFTINTFYLSAITLRTGSATDCAYTDAVFAYLMKATVGFSGVFRTFTSSNLSHGCGLGLIDERSFAIVRPRLRFKASLNDMWKLAHGSANSQN
jgi:hypothetical protein